MDGLDLLGAELPTMTAPRSTSWGRVALALGAGVVGMTVFRRHPVLAFLDSAALASNVHAVATKKSSVKEAVQNMGKHAVATAGALALPIAPWLGYLAGAVAGDLLIDGEGGGLVEEWLHYENIKKPTRSVIDASFTEVPPDNSKALVVQK